jgi:hypothetical protein
VEWRVKVKSNPKGREIEEWPEERAKAAFIKLVEVTKKSVTDEPEYDDAKVLIEAIEQEIKNSES